MEYLVKDPETGKYWETTDKFERNIATEIPEGMNFAYKDEFNIHFTKLEMGYRDSVLVWQRDKVEVEDSVNQPSHYTSGGIECLDAMQAMLSKDEFIGFLRGNIFKYNWRYKLKNGIEDLKKAKFYQDKLIEVESE